MPTQVLKDQASGPSHTEEERVSGHQEPEIPATSPLLHFPVSSMQFCPNYMWCHKSDESQAVIENLESGTLTEGTELHLCHHGEVIT